LSAMEQIETLLGLMAGVVARIEQQTNLATPNEIAGLQTVAQYIGQLIGQLAEDKAEKLRVKEYSQALGKLMNAVKGFAQRLQEQQAQQNGHMAPEAMAKARAQSMLADQKAQINERSATQKQRHKDVAMAKEQQRKDAQAASEIQRENLKAGAEIG